ncbi:hypothetical protein Cgig2_005929 [Carnegiea gigantea]|uniref:Uncharacterized protein n=1 Tax=Carnegiea gigantea TaxID=171969 RepID=A0A9Q1JMX9_9CARY|nr:hypothetical protein Cgig2_005929 [Carnegiea gigantea]
MEATMDLSKNMPQENYSACPLLILGNSPSENLRTGATMTNKRPSFGFANLRSISVPPRSAIETGTCNETIRVKLTISVPRPGNMQEPNPNRVPQTRKLPKKAAEKQPQIAELATFSSAIQNEASQLNHQWMSLQNQAKQDELLHIVDAILSPYWIRTRKEESHLGVQLHDYLVTFHLDPTIRLDQGIRKIPTDLIS